MFAPIVTPRSHTIRRITAAAAAAATTVVAGIASAAPAEAATLYQGRVTADGGVVARHLPTPASENYGTYAKGKVISIVCKVPGSTVDGNNLWYLTPSEGQVFVSARYVANVGPAPRVCGNGTQITGEVTTTLNRRAAPTTAAAVVGRLERGDTVRSICRLQGQPVAGDDRWYHLQDGSWVSARYVQDFDDAPVLCE